MEEGVCHMEKGVSDTEEGVSDTKEGVSGESECALRARAADEGWRTVLDK